MNAKDAKLIGGCCSFDSSDDLVYELTSAILEDRPAIPGFDHGAQAQRIADAVLESNQTGQWVDVSR